MRRLIDLIWFVLLTASALWLMHWQSNRLDAAAVSNLVGALFGGAAVLLGNWISRSNEWRRAVEEMNQRRTKLKKLIAAELVNVAAGYLCAKPLIDSALEELRTRGGALPDLAILTRSFPRSTPLIDGLGVDLLILEEPAIDALVTLRANLTITRMSLEEAIESEARLGLLRMGALAAGLAHDMEILSECFDRIAPTRKLTLGDKPAESAAVLLRRTAGGQP